MRISVVTVSYNSAKTIAKTIASVQSQTYPDVEHVFIDGGSTDGTVEIIKAYLRPNDVLLSEPDKGIYDGMNKGIRLATGEVVGTLNSDDFFANDQVLSQIAQSFRNKQIDMVWADVLYINEKDQPQRLYRSGFFRPWMVRFGVMPAHPTFYARKNLLGEVGDYGIHFSIAADFEYILRTMRISQRFLYVPAVWVHMLAGGVSNSSLSSRLKTNREILEACKNNGVYTNPVLLLIKLPFKLFNTLLFRLK
jgi:glycosyltransferase involved in cell wall biosynthesis